MKSLNKIQLDAIGSSVFQFQRRTLDLFLLVYSPNIISGLQVIQMAEQ